MGDKEGDADPGPKAQEELPGPPEWRTPAACGCGRRRRPEGEATFRCDPCRGHLLRRGARDWGEDECKESTSGGDLVWPEFSVTIIPAFATTDKLRNASLGPKAGAGPSVGEYSLHLCSQVIPPPCASSKVLSLKTKQPKT